jgi:hypothetical protein
MKAGPHYPYSYLILLLFMYNIKIINYFLQLLIHFLHLYTLAFFWSTQKSGRHKPSYVECLQKLPFYSALSKEFAANLLKVFI